MQGTFKTRGILRRDRVDESDEEEEEVIRSRSLCHRRGPAADRMTSANANAEDFLFHQQTTMELTNSSRIQIFEDMTSESRRVAAMLLDEEEEEEEEDDDDDVVVDSRENPPVAVPIHLNECTVAAKKKTIWKPRGLTLSAFRRPEHTIRLTDSDPRRKIEAEYNLHGVSGKSGGVLGHGAFSTVRLAMRLSDGKKVAVKSIAKHEALRSRRLRHHTDKKRCYLEEWEILKRLKDQPHVIDLLDVFETTEEIQLVTEYCPGGELFDSIQKKQRRNHDVAADSEAQAAQIVRQILTALVDIHAAGIVHRDVKPENILLAKPTSEGVHVKLCDFGVARPLMRTQETGTTPRMIEEAGSNTSVCISNSDGEASPLTPCTRSRSFSMIGSDYYAAPELTYGDSYDTAVDIYSLGVTLYILLCGFPPVFASPCQKITQDGDGDPSSDDDDDDDELPFGEVLFPDAYWSDISEGAKALLKKMLHPDAAQRVTARAGLQDDWIVQACAASDSKTKQKKPSPMTQAPVDLNLVRRELYKTLGHLQQPQHHLHRTPPRRSSSLSDNAFKRRSYQLAPCQTATTPSPRKRARSRMERRASTSALMALADLYRGVAAPSVIAAAAAAAAATSSASDTNCAAVTSATPTSPKKDQVDFTVAKGSPVPAISF